mmetsp:Transcript_20576/g.31238  ORF Transcript_20576/g.31238 Transcript_20576/m.31238 type:complete len:213 (+) Transcript_20576:531-1169(+)
MKLRSVVSIQAMIKTGRPFISSHLMKISVLKKISRVSKKFTRKMSKKLIIQMVLTKSLTTQSLRLMKQRYPLTTRFSMHIVPNLYLLILRREMFFLDLTRKIMIRAMIRWISSECRRRCFLRIRNARMQNYWNWSAWNWNWNLPVTLRVIPRVVRGSYLSMWTSLFFVAQLMRISWTRLLGRSTKMDRSTHSTDTQDQGQASSPMIVPAPIS